MSLPDIYIADIHSTKAIVGVLFESLETLRSLGYTKLILELPNLEFKQLDKFTTQRLSYLNRIYWHAKNKLQSFLNTGKEGFELKKEYPYCSTSEPHEWPAKDFSNILARANQTDDFTALMYYAPFEIYCKMLQKAKQLGFEIIGVDIALTCTLKEYMKDRNSGKEWVFERDRHITDTVIDITNKNHASDDGTIVFLGKFHIQDLLEHPHNYSKGANDRPLTVDLDTPLSKHMLQSIITSPTIRTIISKPDDILLVTQILFQTVTDRLTQSQLLDTILPADISKDQHVYYPVLHELSKHLRILDARFYENSYLDVHCNKPTATEKLYLDKKRLPWLISPQGKMVVYNINLEVNASKIMDDSDTPKRKAPACR